MPCGITNLELLQSDTTTAKGLIVALENGDIRVYHEKNLVSTFSMQSPLTAIKYIPLAFFLASLPLTFYKLDSDTLGARVEHCSW
jgi:hypothetical protein